VVQVHTHICTPAPVSMAGYGPSHIGEYVVGSGHKTNSRVK